MADSINFPCPHCQQNLKVKDSRLLGKTVKCPKCAGPVFVTRPTALKSASPTANPAARTGSTTGTTKGDGHASQAHETNLPLKTPQSEKHGEIALQSTLEAPPAAGQLAFPDLTSSSVGRPGTPLIFSDAAVPQSPSGFPVISPDVPHINAAPTAAQRYLRTKNRNKNRTTRIAFGVCILVGSAIAAFMFYQSVVRPRPVTGIGSLGAQPSNLPTRSTPYSAEELADNQEYVEEFQPTHGKPIELYMVPSGVSLVIHLRPAELWSDRQDAQVLRSSLTSEFTNWLAGKIQEQTHRRPEQIEELLLGVICGARGTEPDICAVVHLKEAESLADLVQEFKGAYLNEVPVPRIKVNDTQACLIQDERTLAMCPAKYAADLEDWIESPNYEVPEGVAQALKQTDRTRLFTVVAQTGDMQRHADFLFPASTAPLMKTVCEWLGDDVETLSWSVHPQPYLHSELHLRPVATTDVQKLQTRIAEQLNALPTMLWKDVCLKMHPQELRFRTMVGRFPAMVEAFRQSTVANSDYRQLSLTTVLPAKAAPNLALALMFTVNEAARTDFGTPEAPRSDPTSPALPATIAERLKLAVDVEFNRTPLEQALAYLCEKIEVNLVVDGDALKDAGYTKNMPQTMNLGKVPVEQAFANILGRYQEVNGKMVIWLDESTKTVHVTTQKFAERDSRTPLDILPK